MKILILDHARIYMQFNLLCVHKDRECYYGLFPSENSSLESFICGMKLISSEIGFTVNNDSLQFLLGAICNAIHLSGKYVTTNTIFNLGPP